MKREYILLLALCMLLCSCGKSTDTSSSTKTDTTTLATTTITSTETDTTSTAETMKTQKMFFPPNEDDSEYEFKTAKIIQTDKSNILVTDDDMLKFEVSAQQDENSEGKYACSYSVTVTNTSDTDLSIYCYGVQCFPSYPEVYSEGPCTGMDLKAGESNSELLSATFGEYGTPPDLYLFDKRLSQLYILFEEMAITDEENGVIYEVERDVFTCNV